MLVVQSCHHLFVECRAWASQIRKLWERIGKDCGWEYPRAPAVRWLWDERATGAVLDCLEDTRAGCGTSARAASGSQEQEGGGEGEDQGSEGEEGGPGPP